jgi:hypothetical protein
MTCDGKGNHDLQVIFLTSCGDAPDAEYVVRWCAECGAIVVDIDMDGRTAPGRARKMELPRCSKPKT